MAVAFNLNPNLFSLVFCPWIYHPVPRLPLSSLHNRLPNPFPAALNPHESHGMLSIFSWVGHPPFQVCVFKLLRLLSNQLHAPASFPLTDRMIGQNIGVIFNSVLPFINSTPVEFYTLSGTALALRRHTVRAPQTFRLVRTPSSLLFSSTMARSAQFSCDLPLPSP